MKGLPHLNIHCPERHKRKLQNIQHGMHLSYFAMIFFHGPYDIMAAFCFIVGGLAWVLRVE